MPRSRGSGIGRGRGVGTSVGTVSAGGVEGEERGKGRVGFVRRRRGWVGERIAGAGSVCRRLKLSERGCWRGGKRERTGGCEG